MINEMDAIAVANQKRSEIEATLNNRPVIVSLECCSCLLGRNGGNAGNGFYRMEDKRKLLELECRAQEMDIF